MQNQVFFPQACLDQWGIEGKIELSPTELVIVAEARRYRIQEVVRVVLEVTGANDPHGFVGKVRSKAELQGMGAEIMENSMIVGENAYDVVPGWAGVPATPYADHLKSPQRTIARRVRGASGPDPSSDEDLLRQFAGGTL